MSKKKSTARNYIFLCKGVTAALLALICPASLCSAATVLFQQTGVLLTQELSASHPRAKPAPPIQIATGSGPWHAMAMNQNQILFSSKSSGLLAIGTIDEREMPPRWITLDGSFADFVPVALEGRTVLIQREDSGELRILTFAESGRIVSNKQIWAESKGWIVRGMDTNRMVLEHSKTGQVVIWAGNPKAALFRPYPSFTLADGWSVRDFAGGSVLIQHNETGTAELVELGDEYKAEQYSNVLTGNNGCHAIALTR